MKILIIDDELVSRKKLEKILGGLTECDIIDTAKNGADGLFQANAVPHPDIILLDGMMPDMDGFQVIQKLKNNNHTKDIPVIFVTGLVTPDDEEKGLILGAVDYITKPFRLGVLLARLRAQLRQHEQSEDAVFTIGPYTFQPSGKILIEGETQKKIRLTEKETSILKYLYRKGSQVVGRDTLLNEVWGYNAGVTTHTLETHVYRLRQKIEIDPSNAKLLVTETGGYRLVP